MFLGGALLVVGNGLYVSATLYYLLLYIGVEYKTMIYTYIFIFFLFFYMLGKCCS